MKLFTSTMGRLSCFMAMALFILAVPISAHAKFALVQLKVEETEHTIDYSVTGAYSHDWVSEVDWRVMASRLFERPRDRQVDWLLEDQRTDFAEMATFDDSNFTDSGVMDQVPNALMLTFALFALWCIYRGPGGVRLRRRLAYVK